MNYYPFHIGDYASATRHLSWDEDLAYRRLLDWCYTNEKPLPLDVAKVCRLIVATSDSQRVAAETVLSEFFVSTSDGWIHERVTAELERMRERQEASEEREEHEKTRQQKHRERRSLMFAKLSDVGVYPAWNAKTGELERLVAENCDTPATADSHSAVTAPVTAHVTPATELASQHGQPATAIPTPTPTPTPRSIVGASPAAQPADRGHRLPKDWALPDDWKAWCVENRPDLNPKLVADQFRDFWVAKAGKDGVKLDWQATWRNWCRGQKTQAGGRAAPGGAEDWTRDAR